MDAASRQENTNPNTQTKPEGAMKTPGTPTEQRAMQTTTKANKPSVNNTKPKRTASKEGLANAPKKRAHPCAPLSYRGGHIIARWKAILDQAKNPHGLTCAHATTGRRPCSRKRDQKTSTAYTPLGAAPAPEQYFQRSPGATAEPGDN